MIMEWLQKHMDRVQRVYRSNTNGHGHAPAQPRSVIENRAIHRTKGRCPCCTKQGEPLRNGDLVRIKSGCLTLFCFVDETTDSGLRPATPSSAVWLDALKSPEWDSIELLERCIV